MGCKLIGTMLGLPAILPLATLCWASLSRSEHHVDATDAASWYERAAPQGDAWGQRNFARLLRDGQGVARTLNLASAAE